MPGPIQISQSWHLAATECSSQPRDGDLMGDGGQLLEQHVPKLAVVSAPVDSSQAGLKQLRFWGKIQVQVLSLVVAMHP